MFGRKSLPSRIYSYAAKAPRELERVNLEMRRGFEYQRDLVLLEQKRREAWEKLVRERHPEIVPLWEEWRDLDQQITDLYTELRARNAKNRTKTRDPEAKRRLDELFSSRKRAWEAYKKRRSSVLKKDTETQALLEKQDQGFNEKGKELRKNCGLFWATKSVVEQAMMAAKKSPAPPRLPRWEGQGHMAVQFQKGCDPADVFTGVSTYMRVAKMPEDFSANRKFPLTSNSAKSPWMLAYFRVGTLSRGVPEWIAVPFRMHRPLPDKCRLKWAYLIRRRVATDYEWYVQFVLSTEDETVFAKPTADSGAVGVDVGYRLRPEGLRVAYWRGSDGQEGELVLATDWLQSFDYLKELASRRDKEFATAVLQLQTGLRELSQLPDWLTKETETLGQWRAPSRLAVLMLHWSQRRFDGDEALFRRINSWRKRDKRAYLEQMHLQQHLQNVRKNAYQRFARKLAMMYREVHVEALEVARMARKVSPLETENGALREYLRQASLGQLLECLRNSGMQATEHEPQNTTLRCHACKFVNKFDDPARLHQRCSQCGASWDQDQNAAINLLYAGVDAKEPVPA